MENIYRNMVKITEPMTMITDYILTVQTVVYAILILLQINDELSRIYWGSSLFFVAASAFFGGTSHGFKENLSEKTNNLIWKGTVISVGFGGMLMLIGTTYNLFSTNLGIWISLSVFSFVLYLWRVSVNDGFITVILYYVPTLLLILVGQATLLPSKSPMFIIIGIVITFIGFGIQAAKVAPHENFNHNDLFHVVQMIGAHFIYLGIIIMTDL